MYYVNPAYCHKIIIHISTHNLEAWVIRTILFIRNLQVSVKYHQGINVCQTSTDHLARKSTYFPQMYQRIEDKYCELAVMWGCKCWATMVNHGIFNQTNDKIRSSMTVLSRSFRFNKSTNPIPVWHIYTKSANHGEGDTNLPMIICFITGESPVV